MARIFPTRTARVGHATGLFFVIPRIQLKQATNLAGPKRVQATPPVTLENLYDAYCDYANRRSNARVEHLTVFGRLLTKILGTLASSCSMPSGSRPPGYSIPDAIALRQAVHAHLKTGKYL
jgi:hypothetical protein